MSEELIDPDLKEQTCRVIARSINDTMENAIKAYANHEWFNFKANISDLRELFDVFREYCLVQVLPEEEEK